MGGERRARAGSELREVVTEFAPQKGEAVVVCLFMFRPLTRSLSYCAP